MKRLLTIGLILLALTGHAEFFKNVASQGVYIYAYDETDGTPKTGDAASISGNISKDGGARAALNDVNPAEIDATNCPGVYWFALETAETNCGQFCITAISTTPDVAIAPVFVITSTVSADVATVDGVVDGIAADYSTLTEDSNIGIDLDDTTGTLAAGTEITGLADEADVAVEVWATATSGLTTAGTAGKALVDIEGDVDGIQTHGDSTWATATGFSTHSAADVWTNVTRSLTDKDDFTLSAAGIEEIWDDLHTDNDTTDSWGELLQAMLEDTDELQIDWADGGRLEVRFDGIEGAEFATETDSLEAIRTQGDATWATATEVDLSDGAITAAKIAADAIDADAIAADAIGASELAADAVTEIDNAWNAALTELATDPGGTPTPRHVLALLYMANRNRVDTTSSTLTYYNDAGEAVFTIALSDDGTTFTRAEMADAE